MPESHKPIIPLYGRYPSTDMKAIFPHDPSVDFRNKCSEEMREVFSDPAKYLGWRKVWRVLAEEQKELGLPYTDGMISAIRQQEQVIDYDRARTLEREMKHDTNAFLAEFKEQVEKINPDAGKILHAGGTSCLITDHQELYAMKLGLSLIRAQLGILRRKYHGDGPNNSAYAANYDFVIEQLDYRIKNLKARGTKGTTGTQASYLELFNGDHEKVKALDQKVSEALGFDGSYTITGQTYPRIVDYQVLSTLGLVAELLKQEKGESLRKVSSYLNHVQQCAGNSALMAASQWAERSLDDSSERRIIIPESFYALDYALDTLIAETNPTERTESPNAADLHVISKGSQESKGLELILAKLANAVDKIHSFAVKHRDVVCTAYTHYQFAQPTTYGKRLDLWDYGFVLALKDVENALEVKMNDGPFFLGLKDYFVQSRLNQAVIAASKMAHDVRLLQHDLEVNEPFGIKQVGSSAMAYKKNPMKCERINGLARVALSLTDVHKEQNYAFLAADSVMELVLSIFVEDSERQKGFTVHPAAARANLMKYMPFLVTENLMMARLKEIGDNEVDGRKLHETVRQAMLKAREEIDNGRENNMLELLAVTGKFNIDLSRKAGLLEPSQYIGRSREQVDEFGEIEVAPIRKRYETVLGREGDVQV